MNDDVLDTGVSDYVTTRKAARMLGLSTSMVQIMLDRQEIEGWKTPGGHRRISTQSLQAFQQRKHIPLLAKPQSGFKPLIMVVSENASMHEQLQEAADRWQLPFEYSWPVSLESALCEMLRVKPSQLVFEPDRPAQEVSSLLETLGALQALQPLQWQTVVTVVASEDVCRLTTDLGIQQMPGPLNAEWLRAFLAGMQACDQYLRKKARDPGAQAPAAA